MVARILVHIAEFTLSIIYIIYMWPIYVENDFIYGCLWSIGYIAVIAFYSGIAALIPAMQIACGVSNIQKTKRWTHLLSNAPWLLFSTIIFFIFGTNLGYLASFPIIIPNLIYLVLQISYKK